MIVDYKSKLAIKFKNYVNYYNSTAFLNFWPWQIVYIFLIHY